MLSYCSNVHPGEKWSDVLRNTLAHPFQVREQLIDAKAFQLGLWISAQAAEESVQKNLFWEFKEILSQKEMKVHSLNAFPFGNFHQNIVKYDVYQPNWAQKSRLDYLKNLLFILKHIPCQPQISISTLPLGYQTEKNTNFLNASAHFLSEAASMLDQFEQETGLKVHLALEPEPHCALENSNDVIDFYKNYLLGTSANEPLLLDKIRICYDTCHAAIQFEEPQDILKAYSSIGIQVGKVQISSAVQVDFSKENKKDIFNSLQPLVEETKYLHQVIGFEKGQRVDYADLSLAIEKWSSQEQETEGKYRIHFHVPIYLETYKALETTQKHIIDLLSLNQSKKIADIWEVETYTWDVLPLDLKTNPINQLIAQEMNWCLQRMNFHDGSKN